MEPSTSDDKSSALIDLTENDDDNTSIFYPSRKKIKRNDPIVKIEEGNDVDVKMTDQNEIQILLEELKVMFPNVDENYIRCLCVNTSNQVSREDNLNFLVNQLLVYGEKLDFFINDNKEKRKNSVIIEFDHELSEKLDIDEFIAAQDKIDEEKRKNEELFANFLEQEQRAKLDAEALDEEMAKNLSKEETNEVDEKIKIIESILPEVNPEELKKIIETNPKNLNLLEEFVESKLTNKDYVKRSEYFAKLRNKTMMEQYTTKFNVEEFIRQFPEPVQHFENEDRKCTFQEINFNYLKRTYDIFNDKYLGKMYEKFNYNLSLTVAYLKKTNQIKPNFGQHHDKINDIPLLQEIAFIENKNEILKYLEAEEVKEQKELQELRKNNLLLECQCCYDEMKPYESIECKNNHLFCKKCLIRGTDCAISNGETTLLCFMGCNDEFGLDILRRVLPKNTYENFLKKRQDVEVKMANITDLAACPFCPFVMELGPDILIFMCKNPECKKISCRKCKKLNHLPIKCEDVIDEEKARLFVEEEMTKGLVVYCYKCQKAVVKDGGCQYVRCVCGAEWCHICKQPTKYHAHTNGTTKCSNLIFSQGNNLATQRVNQQRELAFKKLRQQDPDVKLPNL